MKKKCGRPTAICAFADYFKTKELRSGNCMPVCPSFAMQFLSKLECAATQLHNSGASLTALRPRIEVEFSGSCLSETSKFTTVRHEKLALGAALAFDRDVLRQEPASIHFFDTEGRLVFLVVLEHLNRGVRLSNLLEEDEFIANRDGLTSCRTHPSRKTRAHSDRSWIPEACRLNPEDPIDFGDHLDSSFFDCGIARRCALDNWSECSRRKVDKTKIAEICHLLTDVRMPVRCCVSNTAIAQISEGAVCDTHVSKKMLRMSIGRATLSLSLDDIDDVSITTVNSLNGQVRSVEVYDWRCHLVARLTAATREPNISAFWQSVTNNWAWTKN